MGKNAKQSLLAQTPAWALSLLTIFTLIGFIAIIPDAIPIFRHEAYEIGSFIFGFIFIILACFLICKKYPTSVWYTPIICNSLTIGLFIIEPPLMYSMELESIFLVSNLILSVTGAILGARIGRRKAKVT